MSPPLSCILCDPRNYHRQNIQTGISRLPSGLSFSDFSCYNIEITQSLEIKVAFLLGTSVYEEDELKLKASIHWEDS